MINESNPLLFWPHFTKETNILPLANMSSFALNELKTIYHLKCVGSCRRYYRLLGYRSAAEFVVGGYAGEEKHGSTRLLSDASLGLQKMRLLSNIHLKEY